MGGGVELGCTNHSDLVALKVDSCLKKGVTGIGATILKPTQTPIEGLLDLTESRLSSSSAAEGIPGEAVRVPGELRAAGVRRHPRVHSF